MSKPAPYADVIPPPGGALWRRSARRRYAAGPTALAELVVLHGLQGRARYLLDGTVYELGAGSLLWAFAGQRHVLLSDSSDFDMWVLVISERVLAGDEPGLPPLSIAEAGAAPPRVIPPAATTELASIAAAAEAAPIPDIRALGLRWWLARAWAHWHAAPEGLSRPVHPAVARAAAALREDPRLAIAEVARRSGLSQSQLGKLFKAATGASITDYRTEQRLERVESAMYGGGHNLLSAALEAGFGSYSQFYRAFVARTGRSPRAHYLGA